MRNQEVWLIDGDRVLVYWAIYPLKAGISLASGKMFERVGSDIYVPVAQVLLKENGDE